MGKGKTVAAMCTQCDSNFAIWRRLLYTPNTQCANLAGVRGVIALAS